MKRKTTKILIIIILITFISTLFLATFINHIFNYIPYYQDFETIPEDWTLTNSSITEELITPRTKCLNLSKDVDGNLSYAIYDYNHSLYEKEINFWFFFESIESLTPIDILFIHDPSIMTTNKDFKLWLNTTHIVSASYNYTFTSFSSAYSSIELINNTWYYFSIKFRSEEILIYLNDSQILEINDYSLGSASFDFLDLVNLNIGGSGSGLILLGKNVQYPFESTSYKMYFDGFEIKEIIFPIIPGFPPMILLMIIISSTIIILNKRYRNLYKKKDQ